MLRVWQFRRSAWIGAEAISAQLSETNLIINESIMTRIPKVLLAVSLTAFVFGGAVTFGTNAFPITWTVAMPLGAVCLGLFLVTFLLQKEVALFDEEERARLDLASSYAARTPAKAAATAVVTSDTNLSPAHSH